jgi:hypothetical protein
MGQGQPHYPSSRGILILRKRPDPQPGWLTIVHGLSTLQGTAFTPIIV